jgi:NMD protein affecting ribosome stability and mRNA decay
MPEKKPCVTYAYWGVECKTDTCRNIRNTVIIKFWGTWIEGEPEPPVILPKKITVICPTCSRSYEYYYEAAEIIRVYRTALEANFVDLC